MLTSILFALLFTIFTIYVLYVDAYSGFVETPDDEENSIRAFPNVFVPVSLIVVVDHTALWYRITTSEGRKNFKYFLYAQTLQDNQMTLSRQTWFSTVCSHRLRIQEEKFVWFRLASPEVCMGNDQDVEYPVISNTSVLERGLERVRKNVLEATKPEQNEVKPKFLIAIYGDDSAHEKAIGSAGKIIAKDSERYLLYYFFIVNQTISEDEDLNNFYADYRPNMERLTQNSFRVLEFREDSWNTDMGNIQFLRGACYEVITTVSCYLDKEDNKCKRKVIGERKPLDVPKCVEFFPNQRFLEETYPCRQNGTACVERKNCIEKYKEFVLQQKCNTTCGVGVEVWEQPDNPGTDADCPKLDYRPCKDISQCPPDVGPATNPPSVLPKVLLIVVVVLIVLAVIVVFAIAMIIHRRRKRRRKLSKSRSRSASGRMAEKRSGKSLKSSVSRSPKSRIKGSKREGKSLGKTTSGRMSGKEKQSGRRSLQKSSVARSPSSRIKGSKPEGKSSVKRTSERMVGKESGKSLHRSVSAEIQVPESKVRNQRGKV